MTETSTSTRIALEVPTPWTLLTVGERHDSSTYSGVNYSGVCVNTDEHVRMYAMGDAASSDVVAQAVGKVWLQAKHNLVTVAEKTVIVGGLNDCYVAASDGMTVLAGFQTVGASSEASPASFPAAADKYDSKAVIASTIWAGFDIAMGIVTGVTAAVQALLLGNFTWIAATKAVLNTIGTAVNIAGLGWSKDVALPGLNLFSEGGSFYCAVYGSVNIHGFAGLLMGSLFHYEIAWGAAKVRGFKRASMSAVNSVDLCAGLWFESKTDGESTFAARAGSMKVRGVKMKLGQAVTKYPQAPTLTQTYSSLTETSWDTLAKVTISALQEVNSTALADTTIDGIDKIEFKCGAMEVTVKNAQVVMGNSVAGARLKAAPNGLTMQAPGFMGSVICQPTQVEIKSGAGSLKVMPGSMIAVDGLEFKVG